MERIFNNLRMVALSEEDRYSLDLCIASGFVDFSVSIGISEEDFKIICEDKERAAFLQAALHHPFQLKETALNEVEQRKYLNVILHGSKADVEKFLTNLDHGRANGSISNMLRITEQRDQSLLRQGHWFK